MKNLLCLEKELFLYSQNTRGKELLIMHIPITILLVSGMIGLWLSLNQQLVKKFPVNAKGGYYDKDLYPCKVLCFLKATDDSIHAVVHCCNASNHDKDGTLVERWN